MSRGELILRQWNLLQRLQTRGEGIPLRDLAEEFGVSERTIQRDFEVLQELGFPIDHQDDESGKRYWRMPHDFFRTGPLVLSLTEALSLHLAQRLIEPLAGTHFAEGLGTVLQKIRGLVPQRALDHFAGLDEVLHVRPGGETDYSAHAGTIRALADAVRTGRTVQMTYRSLWRGEEYETRCDPYGLVYYEGDLFLVGHSRRAGAIRLFKVTRIAQVVETDARFDRPEDFRLEEHFRGTFGISRTAREPVEIVVRFTGSVAALVEERIWHESQRLSWLPAEDALFAGATEQPEVLIATFRLSDTVEFQRWVLGFGHQAEVLKPEWLRRELGEELAAAARLYEA